MKRGLAFALTVSLLAATAVLAQDNQPLPYSVYLPMVYKRSVLDLYTVNLYIYPSPYGGTVVTGELLNATGASAWLSYIYVNFFDAGGTLVDVAFGWPNLYHLLDGDRTCFEVDTSLNQGEWTRFEFEPLDHSQWYEDIISVDVVGDTGQTEYYGYTVRGFVRNGNEFPVSNVTIAVTLYDSDRHVVGCSSTYPSSSPLAPGQSSSFEISTYFGRAQNVASYRVQTEAIR